MSTGKTIQIKQEDRPNMTGKDSRQWTTYVKDQNGQIISKTGPTSDYQEAQNDVEAAKLVHGLEDDNVEVIGGRPFAPGDPVNYAIPKDEEPSLMQLSNLDPMQAPQLVADTAILTAQLEYPSSRTSGPTSQLELEPRFSAGLAALDARLIRHQEKTPGYCNTERKQNKIKRPEASSEWVKQGKDNNAFIVIGNDRRSTECSGYGGQAFHHCDMIDLVAGLGGPKPKGYVKKGDPVTNPSFARDAARIYISQRTNIDDYFTVGRDESLERLRSRAKSGIGIKADHVRVVAREHISLVTNTDSVNSADGDIRGWNGIYLVANNDTEHMHPIPRGNNLSAAMEKIIKNIEKLAQILHGFIVYQMSFNRTVQNHTHTEKFYAQQCLISKVLPPACIKLDVEALSKTHISFLSHLTNLGGFRNNFLKPSGKHYINSKFNKTN
jgi:hypothetical protein